MKRATQLETELNDAVHKDVYANVLADPADARPAGPHGVESAAAMIPGVKAMTREVYDYVIAKRAFDIAIPGHQVTEATGRIAHLEGPVEQPGSIAKLEQTLADPQHPPEQRAELEQSLKDARSELKNLKAGMAISVPGPGGPAGSGYNTYAVVQVIASDGRLIAWGDGRYTGSGPHAEQIAIDQLRSRLDGKDTAGARIVVVGDREVCSKVCWPDLQQFAAEIGGESVTGHVYQRPKASGSGLASEKTTARTATQRSVAEKVAGSDGAVPLTEVPLRRFTHKRGRRDASVIRTEPPPVGRGIIRGRP